MNQNNKSSKIVTAAMLAALTCVATMIIKIPSPLKGYMKFLGGGRNWLILVFSLLLAFFMWSVMKLSRNYSSYMRFQVSVTTNIEGRRGSAIAEDVLVIGAKSTGFTILQNRNDNEIAPLLLEGVDAKLFHKCGAGEEYLLPRFWQPEFSVSLPKNLPHH